MSYEQDKKAFEKTAARIQQAAKNMGKNMSFSEAQQQLRRHIKKANK